MPGASGGSSTTITPPSGGIQSFAGIGIPRTNSGGVIVHAPSSVTFVSRGSYVSVLPDGQKSVVDWSDGEKKYDYPDGTGAGLCDSVVSANKINLGEGEHIDWDLHDMSEPNNDLGHGDAEDNLGLPQYVSRVYALLVKNWTDQEFSSGVLLVGASPTNEWGAFLDPDSFFKLPPDSVLSIVGKGPAGLPVASDDCNLRFEAQGGDVVFGLNYIGNSQ